MKLESEGYIARHLPHGGIREILRILWDSLRLMVVSLFLINVGLMSVLACGKLGKIQLDGVALAVSTINIIGISTAWGVGSAFDTLFAQGFGSSNKKRVGRFLQTGLIFMLGLCLFASALFINSFRIFVFLHQDAQVARVAEKYLIIFTAGFPFLLSFITISKYLQSQRHVNAPLFAEIFGCVLGGVLQYLLVYRAQLGIEGSAIAHALCFITMFIVIVVFTLLSGVYKLTWTAWSLDCLEDWGSISKLAASALILVCIDWWGTEIGLFLIGSLGTVPLGAAGIIFQLFTLILSVPQGIGVTWVYRIGRCLGSEDADGARRYTNAALFLSLPASLLLSSVVAGLHNIIPRAFTNDTEIISLASFLFPFAAIFMFTDAIKTQLSGVLRGAGKQFLGAVISFITLTVICFAIAVPLTYFTPAKSLGFVIGSSVGGFLCSFFFAIALMRFNWDKEIKDTKERIKQKSLDENATSEPTEKKLLLGPESVRRKGSHLIVRRLVVSFPFICVFVASVALRFAAPGYRWHEVNDLTNHTMTPDHMLQSTLLQ